jgi:hypothetical protein
MAPNWRSGAGRSPRLRAKPPASAPNDAIGPRRSRRHSSRFSGVTSSQRLRVAGVRQPGRTIGWSWRPAPTAGASTTTGMWWARRWSAGPIPDSSSSWGVLTAPQATTTPRVARASRDIRSRT